MSDPKYEGIRTSRHQLYDQTDDEESVDDDDENADEDELDNHGDDFSDEMTEDDEELDSPDGSADEESGSASEAEAPQSGTRSRQQSSEASASLARIDLGRRTSGPGQSESAEAQPEGDIASNLRRTHEADKKKGQAVSRQIVSARAQISIRDGGVLIHMPSTRSRLSMTRYWTHGYSYKRLLLPQTGYPWFVLGFNSRMCDTHFGCSPRNVTNMFHIHMLAKP